jgi:hypothetical protein
MHAGASPVARRLAGDELAPESDGVHRGQVQPWAELAMAPRGYELGWFVGRLRNDFQNRKNEFGFFQKTIC